MTRHNTTPTREYEALLEAHTYELSHHRGQTRICRCGHVPTVDPSSGATQQEYHRTHVASVLAARGNNTAHERLLAVEALHREAYPGAGWCAGCHDAARDESWPCPTRAALSPAPTNEEES